MLLVAGGSLFAQGIRTISTLDSGVSPYYFSPPVRGTCTFTAHIEVPLDIPGIVSGRSQAHRQDGVQIVLHMVVDLVDAQGNVIREVVNDQVIQPLDRAPGGGQHSIVVVGTASWNGHLTNDALAPDAIYTFRLSALLNKVEQNPNANPNSAAGQPRVTLLAQTRVPSQGTVLLDSTPPAVTIGFPGAFALLRTGTFAVQASYTDNLAGVDASTAQVLVNGVDMTSSASITASSLQLSIQGPSALADGPASGAVLVKDRAGNQGSASVQFLVDTVPPAVTINPPDGSVITSLPVTFQVKVTDSGSGLLDGPAAIMFNGQDVTARFQTQVPARFQVLNVANVAQEVDYSYTPSQDDLLALVQASGNGNLLLEVVDAQDRALNAARVTASFPVNLSGGSGQLIEVLRLKAGPGTAQQQRGLVDRCAPLPLVVQVVDEAHGGAPIAGLHIAFDVIQGDGEIVEDRSQSPTTDVNGFFTVRFVAGPAAGANIVSARIQIAPDAPTLNFEVDTVLPRLDVTFSPRNDLQSPLLVGESYTEAVSISPRPGGFGTPWIIRVTEDSSGSPLPMAKAAVEFEVGRMVPAPNGAVFQAVPEAMEVVPSQTRTDADGYAVYQVIAKTVGGPYVVRVSLPDFPGVAPYTEGPIGVSQTRQMLPVCSLVTGRCINLGTAPALLTGGNGSIAFRRADHPFGDDKVQTPVTLAVGAFMDVVRIKANEHSLTLNSAILTVMDTRAKGALATWGDRNTWGSTGLVADQGQNPAVSQMYDITTSSGADTQQVYFYPLVTTEHTVAMLANAHFTALDGTRYDGLLRVEGVVVGPPEVHFIDDVNLRPALVLPNQVLRDIDGGGQLPGVYAEFRVPKGFAGPFDPNAPPPSITATLTTTDPCGRELSDDGLFPSVVQQITLQGTPSNTARYDLFRSSRIVCTPESREQRPVSGVLTAVFQRVEGGIRLREQGDIFSLDDEKPPAIDIVAPVAPVEIVRDVNHNNLDRVVNGRVNLSSDDTLPFKFHVVRNKDEENPTIGISGFAALGKVVAGGVTQQQDLALGLGGFDGAPDEPTFTFKAGNPAQGEYTEGEIVVSRQLASGEPAQARRAVRVVNARIPVIVNVWVVKLNDGTAAAKPEWIREAIAARANEILKEAGIEIPNDHDHLVIHEDLIPSSLNGFDVTDVVANRANIQEKELVEYAQAHGLTPKAVNIFYTHEVEALDNRLFRLKRSFS